MPIDIIADIVPMTKARENLSAIIERARETKRPVIVTQNGSAAVVVLDAAQYQKEQEERDLLRGILAGEDDVRAGRVHTMEEVEAYLDALLKE